MPTASTPVLVVGSGRFLRKNRSVRSTSTGSLTLERKSVNVVENGPLLRVTSNDALRRKRANYRQTRETGGLGLFRERRRREKSRTVGQAARPAAASHQSRETW